MMKRILYTCFAIWSFSCAQGQVNLATDFSDANHKREMLHNVWQVANDISPAYKGDNDGPQIRPDLKMNIIRLSGGIKNRGGKNLNYDMVKWSVDSNDYVYDFERLLQVIDKADEHSDEIYQLVIDNVPWCFQRDYTFVNLDKNSFDGIHFRRFEEVEQYGNALPPCNTVEYGQYVTALMDVLVKNYGVERVKKWRFRIGSEIESPGHWKGSAEDFVAYLEVSIRAIRSVLPDAHVGIHTREPDYQAVSHKGINYEGKSFRSFHDEILTHCFHNDLKIDSWGLSYYLQFDKRGEYYAGENWYAERVAPFVNHPNWNTDTEINLEEFKATASFRGPDESKVTLKSGSSHGEVAHIALSHVFYKHPELNQIHRWLQYEETTDDIANRELLSMVGKVRYRTAMKGILDNPHNQIDAIFVKPVDKHIYEALIYNYNGESTSYESPQNIDLSIITPFPVGTKFEYRSAYYTNSHNKLQSFVHEPDFQENWYVDGIKDGQKLGEARRVLKSDVYNSRYQPYRGHEQYGYTDWKEITTVTSSSDSALGSEILLPTSLRSFSFRKFEFRPMEAGLIDAQ